MTDTSSCFSFNLRFGWRFHPTEEELVDYLKRKLLGDPVHSSDINEVELYKYNPWDLPGIDPSGNSSGDKVWYFLSILERCGSSKLAKRKAGNGHWKSTGDPRSVNAEESDEEIGTKRILVFHNPDATHWVMHQYECIAPPNSPIKDHYVLCKILIKPNKKNKKRPVKRSRKAESSYKTPKARKKAKKGESNCNMASASNSASEKKNSMEIMPSSTNDKGELCIKKLAVSGLGNQKSDKMTATASSCEKGDASHPYAVDFDNHSQGEINSFSTCNKDETSSLIASSFNNQNIVSSVGNCDSYNLSENVMAYTSSYESSETRWPVTSDLENFILDQMTKTSSCKKGKPSCSTAIGLPKHNSYETAIVSSNNKGETSWPMNFGYENQNSIVMAHEPFRHMNFDYENQTSIKKSFHENIDSSASTIGVGKSVLETPYVVDNQNLYEKTDDSIEMAEKLFHDNIDLSASKIGVWKSVLQTPYVVDNQNLYEKTDGVSLMKDYPSPSMASNVKETTFQEVQSQYKGVDTPVSHHRIPMVISNVQEASLQEKKHTNQYNTMDMPRSCSNSGEATLHKMQTQQSDPAVIPIVEDNNLQMTCHGGEGALPKISHELDEVEDIVRFFLN